ncbi:hypothetical protein FQN57_004265 [Myotisia sp. PD_48]|nr:hypothetical protein FQN57_004265 [Myotisia sp. PD_48]
MDAVKHAYHSFEHSLHPETRSGEEPISGVQGAGTPNDPYDAGNASNPHLERQENKTMPVSGNNGTGTHTPLGTGAAGAPDPTRMPQDFQKSKPRHLSTTETGTVGIRNDCKSSDLQSSMAPTTEHRSVNDPTPDPTPLSNVETTSQSSSDMSRPGEKIVRSTGFAADGGDFDATQPGAGKEAERLMDEAGCSRASETRATVGAGQEQHHGGLWTGSHKSGLTMAKAKDKLHIGKNNSQA